VRVITLARRPLAESTITNCVKYSTGALNIDGCRVGTSETIKPGGAGMLLSHVRDGKPGEGSDYQQNPGGRWPSNVILVHPETCQPGYCVSRCPVKQLEVDSLEAGVHAAGNKKKAQTTKKGNTFHFAAFDHNPDYYNDSGGATRFFKCLKEDTIMNIPQDLLDYLITMISTPDMQALYNDDISTWKVGQEKDNSWPGLVAYGQPSDEQAADLKRVLMPGAHLLLVAPESEPTGHTGTCRVEDAGFEIRDAILWIREAGHFHYVPKAARSEREAGCAKRDAGDTYVDPKPMDPDREEDSAGGNNPRNRGANPIRNFHPCLHPDTLVMTIKGYRPIKEIKIGDMVFSADGKFHRVKDVSSHPYTSSHLYDISVHGTNYTAPSSDNHPYLIWRPERRRKSITGGHVFWVEAKDIQKGDYTMTPLCKESSKVSLKYAKDIKFWFLFGLYLADGVLQKAGHGKNCYPSYSLGTDKPNIIGRVVHYFESKGVKVGIYPKKSKAVQVMAFDAEAGELFKKHGGSLAQNKSLSKDILNAPSSVKKAILEGYLAGDGCQVKGRLYKQAKTVSPDLACLMTLLGESIGYRTNLFRYEPVKNKGIGKRKFKTTRPTYHLYFYNQNQKRADRRDSRPTYIEYQGKTYLLRYIKEVKTVNYAGDVVNLTVAGNPTFQTCVGMSHNTVKPIKLMECLLDGIPVESGPILDPFMGSGSTGIACLRTGHDFIGVDREKDYVGIATSRIRHWDSEQGYINREVESDFKSEAKEAEPVDLWDLGD